MRLVSTASGWRSVAMAVLSGAAFVATAIAEGEAGQEQAKVATNSAAGPVSTKVVIETSLGTIKAELWPDKSPVTVSNFLMYVDAKFYDGVVFHRVIRGFMIQAGAFIPDMRQKMPLFGPIRNEGRASVPNKRGTLSMARADPLDSATCQFFINHVDNGPLDKLVYCVFGKVTEGMDIVDAIAKVPTGVVNGMRDVPLEPVVIKKIRRDQPDPVEP